VLLKNRKQALVNHQASQQSRKRQMYGLIAKVMKKRKKEELDRLLVTSTNKEEPNRRPRESLKRIDLKEQNIIEITPPLN